MDHAEEPCEAESDCVGVIMDFSEDFTSQVMAAIAALPPDQQAEAIHALLADMLRQMPVENIIEMRDAISAQFVEDLPIVSSTLNLIDGHLALREISGLERWR